MPGKLGEMLGYFKIPTGARSNCGALSAKYPSNACAHSFRASKERIGDAGAPFRALAKSCDGVTEAAPEAAKVASKLRLEIRFTLTFSSPLPSLYVYRQRPTSQR